MKLIKESLSNDIMKDSEEIRNTIKNTPDEYTIYQVVKKHVSRASEFEKTFFYYKEDAEAYYNELVAELSEDKALNDGMTVEIYEIVVKTSYEDDLLDYTFIEEIEE